MKSHNKCLLAVALVATKAVVGEGAGAIDVFVSVDGATVSAGKKILRYG